MTDGMRSSLSRRVSRSAGALGLGLALAAGLAAGTGATLLSPPVLAATAEAPAAAAPAFQVDGFRSARFGMSEADVLGAIKRDLGVDKDKVGKVDNLSEQTTALTVQKPDLLQVGGPAVVSYILGYKTRTLIQVNVAWGAAAGSDVAADQVVAAANLLRTYFLKQGFVADTMVANAQLQDGTIVVFRGQDQDKRMVLLVLSGTPKAAPKEGETPPPPAVSLQLSYVQNPQSPDVLTVEPGAF
ncbi:hypothetical protein [Zavarzinia sp. CC-PAN008]|uniref:hypothetical protein n=1 Tax=Zavarzinia sp. CC-PAN008 TaxID=3243332 RepID=UPI003F745F4F